MNERFDTSVAVRARIFAAEVHNAAGCTYGDNDKPYSVHTDSVHEWVYEFHKVFRIEEDIVNTLASAYTHDTIEDAQQTYTDVMAATNKEVADITLAVSDVPAENRMLRFLLTAPKIIKDYRALVLKICDIGANGTYGKEQKTSMYRKYQKEWTGYKRYILNTSGMKYNNELDLVEFKRMIFVVDTNLSDKEY